MSSSPSAKTVQRGSGVQSKVACNTKVDIFTVFNVRFGPYFFNLVFHSLCDTTHSFLSISSHNQIIMIACFQCLLSFLLLHQHHKSPRAFRRLVPLDLPLDSCPRKLDSQINQQ